MKKVIFLVFSMAFSWFHFTAVAQFNSKEITRVIQTLAADSMMGRMSGTKYADMAAQFIAAELGTAGLKPLPGQKDLMQTFQVSNSQIESISGSVEGHPIQMDQVMVVSSSKQLQLNQVSCNFSWVAKGDNVGEKVFGLDRTLGDHVIFMDTSFKKIFGRLQKMKLETMPGEGSLVIMLATAIPATFDFKVQNTIQTKTFMNVGGMITGKRKDEYVLFSGHYDHIGIGKPVEGDSIFNGANDDASGTTAVIALAKYFGSQKEKPERTILFATFTAEESGGFGSKYFSRQLNPDQVVAMFN
ncbi:MAG: M28 family peptidase, partial [Chitinophagaceae bacterium]